MAINAQALPVPTVQDIITDALIDAGVEGVDEMIEQPVLNRSFKQANYLLAEWQVQRYMVYHLVDYAFVSTGAQSYTVGVGGNFNVNPRPDRLESAFLRQLQPSGGAGSQVDYPLEILPAREDYNRIVLKTLGTFANSIFYDSGWPNGLLYPWPIPQASIYEIHATFKETLPQFVNLQDKVNLPPLYHAALQWNLAERYRATNQLPEDPKISSVAKRTRNAIRLGNVQVPLLTMPRALRRQGNAAYNYKSDTP
ncbi:MAG TPA: hypothetical protein VKX28_26875 [Xanthobacteraceae bacterium]|nr:hypothetical protein [Xanthobacteraceae bacterium]